MHFSRRNGSGRSIETRVIGILSEGRKERKRKKQDGDLRSRGFAEKKTRKETRSMGLFLAGRSPGREDGFGIRFQRFRWILGVGLNSFHGSLNARKSAEKKVLGERRIEIYNYMFK